MAFLVLPNPSRNSHAFDERAPGLFETRNLSPNRLQELSETEERSFDFRSGGSVQVIGDAGFIRAESWDKEEVFFRYTKRVWDNRRGEAERRLKDLQVEISDQPGQLTIRQVPEFREERFHISDLFDPDTWSGSHYSARIDFELRVPRRCHLILEADEGEITVRQIEGEVEADSDEGDIDLDDISRGDITAKSDEGNIDCRNLQLEDGRLSLVSDEGTQRVSDATVRFLHAETDEGDIILMRLAAGGGNLSCDEGDIELDAIRFDEGAWHFTTDEGNVEMFLPANADAEVEIKTSNGGIRTDFGLNHVSDDHDGERLTGRLGDGRARLEVYTDEGDISLRRR
jgi:hypothetical protein